MDSGETKLKAFDFFKEAAVQLITLASGALVLTATFYKDILSGATGYHVLLECSWALFFLSVASGIGVLGALSTELNDAAGAERLQLYSKNVRWSAFLQLVTFVPAVFLFGLFVVLNMPSIPRNSLPATISVNGPVIANGRLNSTGPVMATGPLTATGAVSATGSVSSDGPINATGRITIRSIAKPHRAGKIRRGRQASP